MYGPEAQSLQSAFHIFTVCLARCGQKAPILSSIYQRFPFPSQTMKSGNVNEASEYDTSPSAPSLQFLPPFLLCH